MLPVFDIVHAFGYRAAWACAESFGNREAWVYSAYDLPKTTRIELIERLSKAQIGLCSSSAVYRRLDLAGAENLEVHYPGTEILVAGPEEREIAKSRYDVGTSDLLIVGLGRLVQDRNFIELVNAMPAVWEEIPTARLIIAGKGPEEETLRGILTDPRVQISGFTSRRNDLLLAADLTVVPSFSTGFSMVAAESMAAGSPVMVGSEEGCIGMVDPNLSGFVFELGNLARTIIEALHSPITLDCVGRAGRVRAQDYYDIVRNGAAIRVVYEGIVGGA